MADSILTPGYQDNIQEPTEETPNTQYLEKDNFLSEYSTDEEKSIVRENLGVYPKNSVYTKLETDTGLSQKITQAIQQYLNLEDPHGILPQVREMIVDMVKTDGSTPFVLPQSGVDPQIDSHLTTKKYVDKLISSHTTASDPHGVLEEVKQLLTKYALLTDIYTRSQLYTQAEINRKLGEYVRRDGTTSITKAQIVADPQIDSHAATKRYVDNVMYDHKVEIDPHGFITILNQRLAEYAKKRETYDKTQTYSRTQIDSIINNVVNQAIEAQIKDYQDSVNNKFEQLRRQNYVKADGSIPFTSTQEGVDAVKDNDLTTLKQVQSLVNTLQQYVDNKEAIWTTSGPVESTVGHLEDNTPVPPTMTFQEVCDAIFYGLGISLEVPDYVQVGDTCSVIVCVRGSTGLVDYAELYQGEELIATLEGDKFEDGCITMDSLPIYEDTEFTFKVYYTNGSMHEVSDIVKCHLPVFVGLLPKWKFANTITMEYLQQLELEDTEGTQNRFISFGSDQASFDFTYKFQDASLRHPFIVIPKNYPNLVTMVTKSQSFGIDAFDVLGDVPLHVEGLENDTIYKIYVYRQALSSMNQKVTYNFE